MNTTYNVRTAAWFNLKLSGVIGSPRFRFLVFGTMASIAALIGLLVFQLLNIRYQYNLQSTEKDLRITLISTLERFETWAENEQRYIKEIGQNPELVTLTERLLSLPETENQKSRADTEQALKQFFAKRPPAINQHFLLIGPQLQILASSEHETENHHSAGINSLRPWINQALQGKSLWVPPFIGQIGGHTNSNGALMFFLAPVTDDQGRVIAVLAHHIDQSHELSQIMQAGRIGASGESYAISRFGHMLTESRFDQQLRNIGLLAPSSDVIRRNFILRDPGANMQEGYRPQIDRHQLPLTLLVQKILDRAASHASQEQTKAFGFTDQTSPIESDLSSYRDYRGVNVLGAGLWHKRYQIGIITEIDEAEAMTAYQTLRSYLLSISGLTLLLCGLAVTALLKMSERAAAEQKHVQQALKLRVAQRTHRLEQSMADYQRLVEDIGDDFVIFTHLPDGTLTFVTNGIEKVFGFSKAEAIGKRWQDSLAWNPELLDNAIACQQRLITGQSQQERFEIRFKHPDQQDRIILVTEHALRDVSGQTTALAGLIRDITEQKHFEEALIQANLKAEEASQAKSRFLASMSHELRTPLNAILGFSQLLEYDPELTDKHRENISLIGKSGKHLLSMVEQVLSLTKLEAGTLDLTLEPVALDQLIENCCPQVKAMAQEQQIDFHISPTPKVLVRADKLYLKQSLYNLLSNAIKYNHPGGEVRLSTELSANSNIKIIIVDSGAGIPPNQLEKLFLPFERLGYQNSSIGGLGLGLSISRRLIALMGGELSGSSKPGYGSQFWIELPLYDMEKDFMS